VGNFVWEMRDSSVLADCVSNPNAALPIGRWLMKLDVLSIACITALAAASSAYAGGVRPEAENLVTAPSGKGSPEQRAPSTEIEALESQLATLDLQAKSLNDNGNNGKAHDETNGAAKPGGGARTVAITYHGGPIMTGTNTVYFIFYGNWGSNTAQTLLPSLISGESGSPYFNINTTYYNASNVHVTNSLTYGGSTVVSNTTHGTSLTDANISTIVSEAIAAGKFPKSTSASYMVLTSAEVHETSGFCTQYCGWHTHATISSADIKYAFIGNPDQCPSACAAQTTSPNGNSGADGMASIIAHELQESVTDPDLNAWYDRQGAENADKCAWTFGTESTASNGSKYNVTLGGKQWLIQQNWLEAGGCTMHYP
jgi:hypothetical protein